MCELTTTSIALMMAAGSMATTAVGAIQQNQAMAQQAESASYANAINQQRLAAQAKQEMSAAEREIHERRMQAQRERSRILVSNAEAGVAGGVLNRELYTSDVSAGTDIGVINWNLENTLEQLEYESLGSTAQMQSRINASESAMVGPLSGTLDAVTRGASTGLSMYQMGTDLGLGSGGGATLAPTPITSSM